MSSPPRIDPAAWRAAGRRVQVLGRQLFVADSDPEGGEGTDRPTLLLLHGFPTSSYDFAKAWPRLSERFRCVAPDLLGFGFSDKPRGHRYTIHDQADRVEALIDVLELPERFYVLAHDYGDTVAQELLARDNARPSPRWLGCCFLNGGLFPETHLARPIQKLLASPAGPLLSERLGQRSFERSFSRVFGPDTQPSAVELEAYWSIIEHGDGRHVFSSLIGYMADRREHRERWVDALREARCPLQLINGSLDPVSGAHMVARFRELGLPAESIVELPDIGHYPQVEATEAVVGAFLRFVDRVARVDQRWDTLIRGATVFDGTGAPGRVEDVALRGGRVVARGIGLATDRADEVIEATGRWLMPGLLDIHTHFDLEVELAPGLPEAVRHGSTTVVMSNCSLGLAYGNQRRDGADPIVDCFARVENVPKAVLKKVADRATWTESGAYLEHLESLPLGPNVVPMIPHSMLRIQVMGLEGSIRREPTASERRAMAALVEQGMAEGYAGFSTDALPFHYLANQPNHRQRIPGQHGSYEELRELTDIVRRFGRVWQATPPKDDPLAVARLFSLTSARLHGRPLKTTAVAALDVESNKGLARLGQALTWVLNGPLGGHFRLQALAAPFKIWTEGAITPLAEEIPPLRWLNELELDDRAGREQLMDDPDWQREFLAMWREGKQGVSVARLKRLLRLEDYAIRRDLSGMWVDQSPVPVWAGEDLASIHQRLERFQRGDASAARSPEERAVFEWMPPVADDAEFFMHLLRRFDRDLVWTSISANADLDGVARRLKDPRLMPGFTDSGAHLTNMAFYDGNLRALKLAQEEGPDAVATMVRRLTREPARFFGLEAGTMDIGDVADLVLVDPVALAQWDPEATVERIHRDVFGSEQLVNRPPGVVRSVWVAGRRLFDGEAFAGDFETRAYGRLLRPANHWPPVAALRAA